MLKLKHCGGKIEILSPKSERDETTPCAVKLCVDVGSNRLATLTSARHTEAIAACRARDTVLGGFVQGSVYIGTGSTKKERFEAARRLPGGGEGVVDAPTVVSPAAVPEADGGERGVSELTLGAVSGDRRGTG